MVVRKERQSVERMVATKAFRMDYLTVADVVLKLVYYWVAAMERKRAGKLGSYEVAKMELMMAKAKAFHSVDWKVLD